MSLHLDAKPNEIAQTVLITGDPLRAEHYAERLLSNPICYNRIRGAFGFTGTHHGLKISIQGTGIGIPSTALYLHELIHSYGVTCVIRVGTCGALQPEIRLEEVILASAAVTDSAAVHSFTDRLQSTTKPTASLVKLAEKAAHDLHIALRKGPVFSTDLFYHEDPNRYDPPTRQGVLGVDMETSILYAMADYYRIKGLSLLTVSDNIVTGIVSSAEDRERNFQSMILLALEVAHGLPV
jgi:purine-nucleoside phosphorylase